MTTVVVVRKAGQVSIATDTLITFGDTRLPYSHEENHKVFKIGDNYFGMSGNIAHFHALTHSLGAMPKNELNLRNKDEIYVTFSKLHKILKDQFFLQTAEYDKDPYESSQYTLLIANPHGIFGVYSYREIFEFKKFWAIGSGRHFALGAMEAIYDNAKSAKEVAQIGVQVGCRFDKSSAEPIHAWSLKEKGVTK